MWQYIIILTAIAMAMDDSVTVSIGLLTNGVFSVSFLVSADVRSCVRACACVCVCVCSSSSSVCVCRYVRMH